MANQIILDRDISWNSLIKSWIFGSSYGIPKFQDAAMNAMIDKDDQFFQSDKLPYIYKNTRQDSPLRIFFRDQFTVMFNHNHSKDWFGGKKDDYPPDFLIDVIGELHRQRENSRHTENHTNHDRQFILQHRHRYLSKSNTKVTKS